MNKKPGSTIEFITPGVIDYLSCYHVKGCVVLVPFKGLHCDKITMSATTRINFTLITINCINPF